MRHLWFTVDTHFSSDDTIIRENRPFTDSTDFDKSVVDIWNKQILSPEDIIYHLGDFCNYNDTCKDTWVNGLNIVKNINCNIILIIGNNEKRIIEDEFNNCFLDFRDFCLDLGFYDVCEDYYLMLDDYDLYLNHFPSKYKDTYVNLFGHTHRATGLYKPFGLNVCCDLNFFRLYSASELIRLLKEKRIYWDNDIDTNIM